MRLSFLLVEECNVICVDWEAGKAKNIIHYHVGMSFLLGAVDPNYVRAAVNTRLVGKQVIYSTNWKDCPFDSPTAADYLMTKC